MRLLCGYFFLSLLGRIGGVVLCLFVCFFCCKVLCVVVWLSILFLVLIMGFCFLIRWWCVMFCSREVSKWVWSDVICFIWWIWRKMVVWWFYWVSLGMWMWRGFWCCLRIFWFLIEVFGINFLCMVVIFFRSVLFWCFMWSLSWGNVRCMCVLSWWCVRWKGLWGCMCLRCLLSRIMSKGCLGLVVWIGWILCCG